MTPNPIWTLNDYWTNLKDDWAVQAQWKDTYWEATATNTVATRMKCWKAMVRWQIASENPSNIVSIFFDDKGSKYNENVPKTVT